MEIQQCLLKMLVDLLELILVEREDLLVAVRQR
jgi:hypothetical protein